MATITVREIGPVSPGLVLREADAGECLAGGMSPAQAVERSAAASVYSREVYVDGELVCYWGFASAGLTADLCDAWLLTTPAMDRVPLRFLRASLRIRDWLLEMYSTVRVLVHSAHTEALQWLGWLGFQSAAQHTGFHIMLLHRGEV